MNKRERIRAWAIAQAKEERERRVLDRVVAALAPKPAPFNAQAAAMKLWGRALQTQMQRYSIFGALK